MNKNHQIKFPFFQGWWGVKSTFSKISGVEGVFIQHWLEAISRLLESNLQSWMYLYFSGNLTEYRPCYLISLKIWLRGQPWEFTTTFFQSTYWMIMRLSICTYNDFHWKSRHLRNNSDCKMEDKITSIFKQAQNMLEQNKFVQFW